MSNRRCAAKTCFNSQKSRPNLKFFTFPKDESLCRQWVINCGRNDLLEKTAEQLSKFLLCAEHFEQHWFVNKYRTSFVRTGQPVPTIFYNNLADFVPKSLKKVCEEKSDSIHATGMTDNHSIANTENLAENRILSDSNFIEGTNGFSPDRESEENDSVLQLYDQTSEEETDHEILKKRGCHKMCRLCACLVYEDKLVSIFGSQSGNQHLQAMISKFLPDIVHQHDGLPHHVCCSCVSKLNKCHQTVESFLAADRKLRALFESQNGPADNLMYIRLEENNKNNSKLGCSDKLELLPDLSEFLTLRGESSEKAAVIPISEFSGIGEKNGVVYVLTQSMELVKSKIANIPSCISQQTTSSPNLSDKKDNLTVSTRSEAQYDDTSCNITVEEVTTSLAPRDNSDATDKVSSTDISIAYRNFPTSISEGNKLHKCSICREKFETTDKLFIHEIRNHSVENLVNNKNGARRYRKREIHKCEECGSNFFGLKPFRRHIKEQHIPAENICEFCGAHYKIKSQLEIHRRLHTNEKPFTCGICQESFHFKKALRRHKRTHIEPKSLTCNICNKTCSNRSAMWRHEKIHSDSRNVLCYCCGKVLSNPQSLRVHMRTHSSERPCSCPTCGKSFKDNVSVNKHMVMHSATKNFQCDICGRAFYSKALVKQHKLSHSGVKPHTCETCGAAFNRLGNLNQHKKKHLNDVNSGGQDKSTILTHECPICSKRLKSELTLKYHLAKHTGEKKPFDCERCGKRFIAVDPYRVHMRIHTGERPYECNVCEKTFRSSFTLKQHSALHKDEHPYPCPFCERKFKRLQSLVVHKRTHTGEKPHQCPVCGRAFAQKGDMLKHTKTHSRDRERMQSVKLQDVMEIEHITELTLSDPEITSEFLIDMPIVEVQTEIHDSEIHVEIQPEVGESVVKTVNSHLDPSITSVMHSDIHADIHSVIHAEL